MAVRALASRPSSSLWLVRLLCFTHCFNWPLYSLAPRSINFRPGAVVNVGIHPSNVIITKLKMDKDRKSLIARKKAASDGAKGKYTTADTANEVE